jgi:hypothetical protein
MISRFYFHSNNKNSFIAQENLTHDYEAEDARGGSFVKTIKEILHHQKQDSPLSEHLSSSRNDTSPNVGNYSFCKSETV